MGILGSGMLQKYIICYRRMEIKFRLSTDSGPSYEHQGPILLGKAQGYRIYVVFTRALNHGSLLPKLLPATVYT